MKNTPRLTLATTLCALVVALTATSAVAQSPAVEGYDETGISRIPPLGVGPSEPGSPPTILSSSPEVPPATDTGPGPTGEREALAFTGLGLPLLALIGGALVAAGALARRGQRSPSS